MKIDPNYLKPVPKNIAIFGATGRIGKPMAKWLRFHSPQTQLRLISTRKSGLEELEKQFPGAEVVQADYLDQDSLAIAFDGIEAAFVIVPDLTDESVATPNMIQAIRKSGCLKHMVRIVGMLPDMNFDRVPQSNRDYGKGIEIQHPLARKLLDEANIPVTYLNCGGSFMDNFLLLTHILQTGNLPMRYRPVGYLDPREVGEAAARLLLSEDARHIHQVYTINNGENAKSGEEVAELMQEVYMHPIKFDGAEQTFMSALQPVVDAGLMTPEF